MITSVNTPIFASVGISRTPSDRKTLQTVTMKRRWTISERLRNSNFILTNVFVPSFKLSRIKPLRKTLRKKPSWTHCNTQRASVQTTPRSGITNNLLLARSVSLFGSNQTNSTWNQDRAQRTIRHLWQTKRFIGYSALNSVVINGVASTKQHFTAFITTTGIKTNSPGLSKLSFADFLPSKSVLLLSFSVSAHPDPKNAATTTARS